jgi:hypothetical protein
VLELSITPMASMSAEDSSARRAASCKQLLAKKFSMPGKSIFFYTDSVHAADTIHKGRCPIHTSSIVYTVDAMA